MQDQLLRTLGWEAVVTAEDDVDDVVGVLVSQVSSLVILFIFFELVIVV